MHGCAEVPQRLNGLLRTRDNHGIEAKEKSGQGGRDGPEENFRFHDCRHTAITRMIQAGLSPMEIMKISGHTQMNTFARYVNPNTQAVQRIADVLSAYHANENAMNTNNYLN